jgi:opacity protein-like surface antigen
MKKTLLMALALTTALVAETPTTPECSPFQGFYLGVNGGMVFTKTSAEFDLRYLKSISETNVNTNGFAYGVMGGYGMAMGNAYVGAEFGIQSNNSHERKRHQWRIVNVPNQIVYSDAKYERGVVFSVAPRLGYIFNKCSMFYLKPAIEFSKDKISFSDHIMTFETEKKMFASFSTSLGFEQAFSKNLLGRVEYCYDFGRKIKGILPNNQSMTLGYKSHAVKFGLAYKF